MMRRRESLTVACAIGAMAACAETAQPPARALAASATAPAPPPSGSAWGDIPDQPNAAAVRAALEGPEENARKCIEPANGPYRIRIVFAFSGEVQSTEILGSPSAGEESCIRAALQAANIGPFRRAKFTLTMTISRP